MPGSRSGVRSLDPAAHRSLALVSGIAAALVFLRAVVPLRHEFLFDSDQAIVGLMAKHLSEFRTFPLFFYGQNYMLGVQAWTAAPFFWLGGPTVQMLRLPLLIIGAAVAAGFIGAMVSRGLSPWLAFVASLPIVATTPAVSLELMTALGASVEPFAYVLLIWHWRRRPVICGALLCFGTLHREFTAFALPALALASWRSWRSWARLRTAQGAASFAAVWVIVDLLKRATNTLGPAGGEYRAGSLTLQAATIMKWLSFEWRPYTERLSDVLFTGFPHMLGLGPHAASQYGLPGTSGEGSVLAFGALAAAAVIAVGRLAWARRGPQREESGDGGFFVYLAAIGGCTVLAYGLNGGLTPGGTVVLRYVLFALLLPVALLGAFFRRERVREWRIAVAALVGVWAAANVVDNALVLRDYAKAPPVDHRRIMADYLVTHDVRYGRAEYWDAYAITFLARERVILASTGIVRISSYQARVEENAWNAVTLVRQPCNRGTRVDAWCVTNPIRR